MHDVNFIQIFTILILMAIGAGVLCLRLGFSLSVDYLWAAAVFVRRSIFWPIQLNYPGDKVLLVGSVDQIAGVYELLTTCDVSRGENAGVTGMALDTFEEGADLAGKALADLNLPTHFGVRVIGIHQGSTRIINPQADERLCAEDQILFLGTVSARQKIRQNRTGGSVGFRFPMRPIKPSHD